jgi:hypothetical protein
VVADGPADVRGEALRDALPDACKDKIRHDTTRQSGLGWRLSGGRAIKAALLLTDDALDDADHALDVRDDLGRRHSTTSSVLQPAMSIRDETALRKEPSSQGRRSS